MTLTRTPSFATHNGNGSATTFPFVFKIPTANDVQVFITDADGVQGDPLSASAYTIDGLNSEDGGNVEYPLTGAPLPAGHKITIRRVSTLTQTTKIRDQRRYDPQVLEEALDKLTMISQETADAIARSIKVPFGEELPENGLEITANLTIIANNIENINTVAENLNSLDTISVVANSIEQIGICANYIEEIILASQGVMQNFKRKFTINSSEPDNSILHLQAGYALGSIVESTIYYTGHSPESGGRFIISEVQDPSYSGSIGAFSSEGVLEGVNYRFAPLIDTGSKVDIRKLGVQCESGITGWHSRFENIVTWARADKIILTGQGTLSCTETVDITNVFFEGDFLEFQAGTAQTATGDAGATFFTVPYTNDEITFTTGTPGVVNFPGHGLSANQEFKFGVSNGGRLPGSLAFLTRYFVKDVLSADTFTISSSVGGAALAFTTAGVGAFYLFQGGLQDNIDTVDDREWSGRIVRLGVVVQAGPGTTNGHAIRDNLTQRVRVRGDGNFDFTTLSSCIGVMHNGDRSPHGKYDYSANYCYVCVGTNTENEKHKTIVRGSYVVHLLKLFNPTSGTNDSMDWELAATNYIFGVQEVEGLDSWQKYTLRLEPRLDPANYAKVSDITGDDAPCFLTRNGKASAFGGIMRGHNGINCFFISGRTNVTGTSNRAWADTVFFDNLMIIHAYGTILNIQNCLKVAVQIFVKDCDDPNGAGQSPAPAFKIGRVSNAAGLRVFGANIKNTVGLEVGDATYYSRDAHLGHWAIEMGDLVQFNTGAIEQTGSAGNPTTLDAVSLVKMKNCVIDLTGMRGNLDIGAEVIEDSTIILDKNALLYNVTVDGSAVCSYGYPTLDNIGL